MSIGRARLQATKYKLLMLKPPFPKRELKTATCSRSCLFWARRVSSPLIAWPWGSLFRTLATQINPGSFLTNLSRLGLIRFSSIHQMKIRSLCRCQGRGGEGQDNEWLKTLQNQGVKILAPPPISWGTQLCEPWHGDPNIYLAVLCKDLFGKCA